VWGQARAGEAIAQREKPPGHDYSYRGVLDMYFRNMIAEGEKEPAASGNGLA
jgi:hypothetical protein